MAETIKIGGELESKATGGIVTRAHRIYDEAKEEYQSQINAETDTTLAEHNSRINALNSQNYMYLEAESGDTLADVFDGVEGAVDTLYRVAKWDGNTPEYNTTVYSEYIYNATTETFKCMDVKEYGIDDEPTVNSENLVKSGGVSKYTGFLYPYILKTVSVNGKNSTDLVAQLTEIFLLKGKCYEITLTSNNPVYSGTESVEAMIQLYMVPESGNVYAYNPIINIGKEYAETVISQTIKIIPDENVSLAVTSRITTDSSVNVLAKLLGNDLQTNNYIKEIPSYDLKVINASVNTQNGNVFSSVTRCITTIPIGDVSAIKITPKTGYKCIIAKSNIYYKEPVINSTIENYIIDNGWTTETITYNIPEDVKTLFVLFSNNNDSISITPTEVVDAFDIKIICYKDKLKKLLPLYSSLKYSDNISISLYKKIIQATVYGDTGEVATSTTRCVSVFSYSELYPFGYINCQLTDGYKIYYMPLSEEVNDVDLYIGNFLPLLHKDSGWITDTWNFELQHDVKSLAVIFAKNDNSAITIQEARDNIVISGVNAKSEVFEKLENYVYPILEKSIMDKSDTFNALFKDCTGKVESFVFFSDPHWYGYYSEADEYNEAHLKTVAKSYLHTIKAAFNATPTDFVVCGGDWLTAHKQSVAVKALAQIDGFTKQLFGEKYYPVFGNHDNNYQGELDATEDTSANDGILSNQQMINLWFRKWGKMYYSFLGSNSRFYVFDSGIDWTTAMDSYKWEQVDWFANQLLNNTDENIILVTHIAEMNFLNPAAFGNDITPIINNVLLISEAYNNRASITVNSVTYNFAEKNGKVRCMLCGHTHFDANATVHSIPLYCITSAKDGAFDMILIDYEAGKLKSVRFGYGSNRVINLA